MAKNTTAIGNKLEDQVFSLLPELVEKQILPVRTECCKFHRKKGYFSQDRRKNIFFENVIEVFSSAPRIDSEDQPTFVVIFECKNYKGYEVEVGHVESFFGKLEQLRGFRPKGYMISRDGFGEGGVNFARSRGIGLIRLLPDNQVRVESHFTLSEDSEDTVIRAITEQGFVSSGSSQFAISSKGCFTNIGEMLKADFAEDFSNYIQSGNT